MSTIKNGQISFQSPPLNQKQARNITHKAH